MRKQKQIPQHHPVKVIITINRKRVETTLLIDLWGLVRPEDGIAQELETSLLNQSKIRPKAGELKRLLESHAVFHGKV